MDEVPPYAMAAGASAGASAGATADAAAGHHLKSAGGASAT